MAKVGEGSEGVRRKEKCAERKEGQTWRSRFEVLTTHTDRVLFGNLDVSPLLSV